MPEAIQQIQPTTTTDNGHLKRAFEVLTAKSIAYTELFNYYDGDQPARYMSARMAELFKDKKLRQFSQNWCAVVVDSAIERIHLDAFDITQDEALTQSLNALFALTELDLDAEDVHKAALICGEAYVFVWKGDEGIEAYYHDPRTCHVFYDPAKPKKKSHGAKWWIGDDNKRYLNLYYPDRIEYYVSKDKVENIQSWETFERAQENAPNPFEVVPIFPFYPDRRVVKSQLKNVTASQDAINKLITDMMVAAEFGAFKQRWVISSAGTSNLKNAPNEIWDIPAGDGEGQQSQVGQFEATELANYLNAIDKLAVGIAVITRTPKHYLLLQAGDPSGEALIAMEAPLNKKCSSFIDRFAPVWREIAAFMLKLNGQDVDPMLVTPLFDRPETVQPRTAAEIRQLNKNAGIPLKTSLRWEGKTDAEIAAMEADAQEERQQSQTSFAQSMLNAQRQFEQNGGTNNGDGE